MTALTLLQPDDWHVHLRDGLFLSQTVNATARYFSKALIMPNLTPPLTSIELIQDYHNRILQAVDTQFSFTPYLTFYLNETVAAEDLTRCRQIPYILGGKLYPAGVTTNSEQGVASLKKIYPLLEIMQQQNLVLQIHGESVVGDIFDREKQFITEELAPLIKNFPHLRVVLEHISTKAAVEFVLNSSPYVAATITPHHLLYNRNHLLAGGIKPHFYCLPILKRQSDQKILQMAATSGNRKFFAGTDSAPHAISQKETACGCAGIYSAPYALALYAQVFDNLNQLDKLNHFLSVFGSEFYQLPVNSTQITLIKKPQQVPLQLPFGENWVIPIAAGETLTWSIDESF